MHARRTGRTAQPPTIEGEAVVIGRRPGVSGGPWFEPAGASTNDNLPPAAEEPERCRQARPARPDLVFPGAVRWTGASAASRRSGLAAAGGVAVLAAALAAVVAGFSAVPATRPAPAAHPPAALFALAETRAGLVAARRGAVLEVAGCIRNLSREARDVPAVRVVVPGAGGFARVFRPGTGSIGAGRSLFFHSTLAVPSATTTAGVRVSLGAAAEVETFPTP